MVTSEKTAKNSLKTTLLLLSTLFTLIMSMFLFLFWAMAGKGMLWYKIVNTITLLLLFFVLGITFAGIIAFFGLLHNISVPGNMMSISSKYTMRVYPLLLVLVQLIGKDKNDIRRAYTQLNNQVLLKSNKKYRAEEILILTPHCLQKSMCGIKITHDIRQCRRCGGCSVEGLLQIQEEFGVETQVVTGGTLARLRIKEKKPKLIIAIACERDLVSGLMDVRNLPVFAIINHRPEGPCQNTNVDIDYVKHILNRFLRGDVDEVPI